LSNVNYELLTMILIIKLNYVHVHVVKDYVGLCMLLSMWNVLVRVDFF